PRAARRTRERGGHLGVEWLFRMGASAGPWSYRHRAPHAPALGAAPPRHLEVADQPLHTLHDAPPQVQAEADPEQLEVPRQALLDGRLCVPVGLELGGQRGARDLAPALTATPAR